MFSLKKSFPLVCGSVRRVTTFTTTTPYKNARVTSVPTSVCPKEMALFHDLSKTWWDADSIVKMLASMTPVRAHLLQKNLAEAGLIPEELVSTERPLQNLNILDVGCGGGFLSESMAKLGGNITGIDANGDLIRVAKDHMTLTPTIKDNLKYINVTVEEFALQNQDKFDVVVSSEVIEHVLDKEMFAENALKCLRPGGSAFFTTMNRTLVSGFYYIYLCEDVLKCIPKGAHEYKKFMRPKEMADLFRKYNCITTNVDGYTLNAISGNWFPVGFPHFNYALHAIKQKSLY